MTTPADAVEDVPPTSRSRLAALVAAVPPALTVAVGLTVFAGGALALHVHQLTGDIERVTAASWAAYGLASTALWFTLTLAIALGVAEIRLHLRGGERGLVTAAAVIVAAMLLWPLAAMYLHYVETPALDWMLRFDRWSQRVGFVAWMLAALLLAVPLARRGGRGLAVAVALLLTTAATHPLATISGWLRVDDRSLDLAIVHALRVTYGAALAATGWWLCRDPRLDARAEPAPALARGLARVGGALVARVAIAVVAALLTALAIGARSVGVLELVFTVVPLALLVTQVVQVTGMIGAAGDRTGPRLRLMTAGILTVWAMVASWCQAIAAFRVARASWHRVDLGYPAEGLVGAARAWPYLLPLVAVVGLLLLLSAVATVRRPVDDRDRADPAMAAVWLIVGTLAALLLGRWAQDAGRQAGELILFTLMVAVANVVATLAVARACRAAAAALRAAADDEAGW